MTLPLQMRIEQELSKISSADVTLFERRLLSEDLFEGLRPVAQLTEDEKKALVLYFRYQDELNVKTNLELIIDPAAREREMQRAAVDSAIELTLERQITGSLLMRVWPLKFEAMYITKGWHVFQSPSPQTHLTNMMDVFVIASPEITNAGATGVSHRNKNSLH